MATNIQNTVKNLELDAETFAQWIENPANEKVISRLGREFWTLATVNYLIDKFGTDSLEQLQKVEQLGEAAAQRIIDQGGWDSFATETALKASTPATATKTAYAADTQKVWRWARTSGEGVTPITGTWTDTGKSPVDTANDFSKNLTGIYRTTNLVNPAQTTQNGYFAAAGFTASAGSTYYAGDQLIPAKVGDTFWQKGLYNILLCKSDGTGIWTLSVAATPTFTIPAAIGGVNTSAVAFIKLCTSKGASGFSSGEAQLGAGAYLPARNISYNEDYREVINTALQKDTDNRSLNVFNANIAPVNSRLNNIATESKNLINPNQELIMGYFGGSGITTHDGTGTFGAYRVGAEYISVKVGDTLWINGSTSATMQFYRADKSPIWTGVAVNGLYIVPATISGVAGTPAFVRFQSPVANSFPDGKNGAGLGGKVPPKFYPYNEVFLIADTKLSGALGSGITGLPLSGKKWIALGDSITNHANCYAKVLADRYGATLTKHSQDGAWVHHGAATIPRILSETYVDIGTAVQYDLITIAAGTNDSIDGTTGFLGSFNDRTTSTFYGALHVLLSGLRSMFPKARIAYISQIPRAGLRPNPATPTPLDLKVKAVKEVCAYYAVPVWVGHENFGFNPDDNATSIADLMPDGLHPNIDGHIWYANRIENFILSQAK